MERELAHSFLIPDLLAVGERPETHAQLHALGFRAVLSLQEEEAEPCPSDPPPAGLRRSQVPMRDGLLGGVPSAVELSRAVEALRSFLDEGRMTYVHCYAGIGRSPMVCMAYLAVKERLSLSEAHARVKRLHPRASPTAGQLAVLAFYLAGLEPPSGKR